MRTEILRICEKYPRSKGKILKSNTLLWNFLLESICAVFGESVMDEPTGGKIYLYCNPNTIIKCRYGNKKKYSSWSRGYLCSTSCLCTKEKRKNTNLKLFGFENTGQSPISKEKGIVTTLTKYGVKNVSEIPAIIEKRKSTMLEKYGVEHNTYLKSDWEKRSKTNLERYGVEIPSQNSIVKEKTKKTLLEKYGVENPFKSIIFQEKSKTTMLERYGFAHNSHLPNTIVKRRNTYYTHFKLNFSDIIQKRKISCNEKYNRDNAQQKHIPEKSLVILNDPFQLQRLLENISIKESAKRLKVSETTISNYHKKHNLNIIKPTNDSSYEREIKQWLNSIDIKYVYRDRKTIYPKELDFYFPKHNFAIEFQGNFWHMNPKIYNEQTYNKIAHLTAQEIWNKDLQKKKLCDEKGIKLITIWEDDWNNFKKKIKKQLLLEIQKCHTP